MKRAARLVALVLLVIAGWTVTTSASASDSKPMRVGSKRFVESYILAEMITQLVRQQGVSAQHEQGLGGTAVVFRALEDGAIDVYPEYTGTLAETAVKSGSSDLAALRAALAPRGLAISEPLGFENTYALAVSRAVATRLGLTKISDLVAHPELRVALSNEFVGRRDGWPGLVERYGLRFPSPKAIDHALAYEAISRGETDVVDVYTTDAKIARFDLVVLADDLHFFPPYEAVLVYRADLPQRVPGFARVLDRLRGAIDAAAMQKMNARADLDGVPFARVAEDFLAGPGASTRPSAPVGLFGGTLEVVRRHGPRHLMLVVVSLAMSVLVGLPLGILAYSRRRIGVAVLGIAAAVQTFPPSRCSASSSRCSASDRSLRSPRSFSTGCSRSSGTRTPASSRYQRSYARPRSRSGSPLSSASVTSSCHWHRAPSSQASRRARSSPSAAPRSPRSSEPAGSESRSARASR